MPFQKKASIYFAIEISLRKIFLCSFARSDDAKIMRDAQCNTEESP